MSQSNQSSTKLNENEQEIQRRAYEKWEQEGRPEGRHDHHWQQAKAELVKIDHAGSAQDSADKTAQKSQKAASGASSASAAKQLVATKQGKK